MSQRSYRTAKGGIVVEGATADARFRVEWDAAGKLVAQEIEIKTPNTTADPHPRSGCHACQQGEGEAKQPQDLTAWHAAMQEATTQP